MVSEVISLDRALGEYSSGGTGQETGLRVPIKGEAMLRIREEPPHKFADR